MMYIYDLGSILLLTQEIHSLTGVLHIYRNKLVFQTDLISYTGMDKSQALIANILNELWIGSLVGIYLLL